MRRLVTHTKYPHICMHQVAVTRTETVTGVEAEMEALTSSLLPPPVHTKSHDCLKDARPQQPPAMLFPACKHSPVVALPPAT